MTDKDTEEEALVIDVETTVKSDIGTSKASAFHPKNRIVAIGGATLKDIPFKNRYDCMYYRSNPDKTHIRTSVKRLIGHNIKFDLHHIRKMLVDESMDRYFNLNVWDTQIVEYILSGQQDKFPALNDVAPRYGGTTKIDEVKELWDSGVQTEDIDEDLLTEYLEGDVHNTEIIAVAQMQECIDRGILGFVESQMDAVFAVADIEFNGMHIDVQKLASLKQSLSNKLNTLDHEIFVGISAAHPELAGHEDLINISSPSVLSKLLFGGYLKYKRKELVGKYKNGNDKYKQVEHTITLFPLYRYNPEWRTKTSISTSDSVLEELAKTDTLGIAKRLQKYRGIAKELSTYVISLSELIYPDGMIHGSLHQCSTSTGRLSSMQPNLQNMPSNEDSEIKTLFTSRFGRDGVIIEADYKQLEVICLAFLSGDEQLIDDILTGKDMHIETGKLVFGIGMSKDQRRIVKTINFGLIYGGKAGTLAKQANVSKVLAQKCIDAFYTRYPKVKQWQEDTFKEVVANRVFEGHTTEKGYPSGRSYYKSVTGRTYVFKEYDKPDWMTWERNNAVFSPQETRNYPVQGLATGDIVPMMVGILFRVLKNNPKLADRCLMINTVHDSIIFDCHKSIVATAMKTIKETLEDAPRYIKERLNLDFNLPLKVDISFGDNWKNQVEYV